ncbi:MAG TPA: hypothetical protein VHL78_12160 [Actinomycetota bacterium]|nr:hypothetical protein [Actinomycetota bacterium]
MSEAPGGALPCAVCGVSLVAGIAPGEVVTIRGRHLRFRRNTDFISCERCLALYRVRDLTEGRVVPVSDTQLVAEGEAVDAEDRPGEP